MRKYIYFLLIISVLSFSSVAFAGFVSAKYAGEFMGMGVGARPMGLGGAYVAVAEDVTAIYWNPAGLVLMKTLQVHGMHAERFAGIVNWDFMGVGIPFKNNLAVGFGFFRLGVDGIPITDIRDPSRGLGDVYDDGTGRLIQNDVFVSKYVNDVEMAFVVSFAKRRSVRFSYGGNIKVIRKSAGGYGAWGIGFDFGVLVNPFRSMKVGMILADGTSTLIAWKGGRKELIAPRMRVGMAYPIQVSLFRVLPVLDFDVSFENLGSTAQQSLSRIGFDSHVGLEVGFRDLFAIRIGADRGHFTTGAGLKVSIIEIDYGFSQHSDLGNTHRISVTLFWDKNRLVHF